MGTKMTEVNRPPELSQKANEKLHRLLAAANIKYREEIQQARLKKAN